MLVRWGNQGVFTISITPVLLVCYWCVGVALFVVNAHILRFLHVLVILCCCPFQVWDYSLATSLDENGDGSFDSHKVRESDVG
jgi:hypothetical protein